jgi:hypothetical protein
MESYNSYNPIEQKAKPSKPERKIERVFVANCNVKYRFSDGTIVRLTDGVSPLVAEAQLKELKTYNRVREVK